MYFATWSTFNRRLVLYTLSIKNSTNMVWVSKRFFLFLFCGKKKKKEEKNPGIVKIFA